MSDKYQEHPNVAVAQQKARAVRRELNLPRKGRNVGRGPHAPIPAVYSLGAVGWTAQECDVLPAKSGTPVTAVLVLTDAAVALGKRTGRDDDNSAVPLDFTAGVVNARPAKYDPKI